MRPTKLTKHALCILAVGTALLACAGDPAPGQLAACPTGPRAAIQPASDPPGTGDADRGATLFARECARCHSRLVEGRSSRLFYDYPRLDCGEFQGRVTDGYLRTVIARGGEAVGLESLMKPFEGKLDAGQIDDLVAYLRSSGG